MRAEHLYIHVPFCGRRCVYCDFSIAVRPRVPVDEYLAALEREWAFVHSESRFDLETLYFGGGTPSKLGGDGVQRLMELVRARATLRGGAEITLEANPEDVTPDAARAWAAAGVNRVSLGVQSFDDAVLRWMHRTHDASTARGAIDVLLDAGLSNLSIDLIFGVPHSDHGRWPDDVARALDLGVPHVSIYGLTVEPHTPLGRWVAREDVAEAPEEVFEREFMEAHRALASVQLEHYEVSNYGKPGFQSRHNWAYWRRRPYGGLGPSAHQFDGDERSWNTGPYADWIARLSGRASPRVGGETLDLADVQSESVYLNLRTTDGIRIAPEEREDVESWIEAGWATLDGESMLKLTPRGWLRLDALANHLTLLRSRSYI